MTNILEMTNCRAKLSGVNLGTHRYYWNLHGFLYPYSLQCHFGAIRCLLQFFLKYILKYDFHNAASSTLMNYF